MSADESQEPILPSPVLPTIRPRIVEAEDDAPESTESPFEDELEQESELPDPESLLASMLQERERAELPDPQALFEAMRSQEQGSADSLDSDALFEEMVAREHDEEGAIDSEALFRQMRAREEGDEDPFDPVALFEAMRALEEAGLDEVSEDEPFDPAALLDEMRSEEDAGLEELSKDAPFDPVALLDEMRSEEDAGLEELSKDEPFDPVALLDEMRSEEDAELEELSKDAPFDPVALLDEMRSEEDAELEELSKDEPFDPVALLDELRFREHQPEESFNPVAFLDEMLKEEEEAKAPPADELLAAPKVKLFHKLKAAFTKKSPFEIPDSPALPLPDAAAMFEALEVEEQLEALEQGLPSMSAAPLPELPDLDALRAELDAEMQAELEPDLLGDLSGPERFVDTVSDLAFQATFSAPEVTPPPTLFKPVAEPVAELVSEPVEASPPKEPSPYRRPAREIRPEEPVLPPPAPSAAPAPPGAPEPLPSEPSAQPIYRPAPSPALSTLKVSSRTVSAAPAAAVSAGLVSRGLAKVRGWKSAVMIPRVSLTLVTRQLAAMLRSGIPLHQSLAFCAESDPRAAPVLEQVVSKVESGYSLSNALREFPDSFDSVYVGLVQSGEMSGRITEMLEKLANVLERELELRKRLISVITYPAMLMLVSLLGTLGFIFFVLPQIMPLFEDLKVDLPWPTQVLMSLREVLLPLTILSTLAGIVTYAARKQIAAAIRARPALRRQLAQLALSVPVLGPVYERIVTSRVLYSLASMLEVGVTMTQALARSEESAGNAFVAFRLARAREDLNEGATVSEAFRDHEVFPQTALQLIIAGEESARTVEMFTFVAKSFDDEVEHALQSAAGYLEPLIMVVMGVIVGFITIAAALPTIQLLQNFG